MNRYHNKNVTGGVTEGLLLWLAGWASLIDGIIAVSSGGYILTAFQLWFLQRPLMQLRNRRR